jgi:acyl carrier protein
MTEKQIHSKVCEIISSYLRLDNGELKPDTHIVRDIGADSLAMVELGFKFSEAFSIGMFNPDEDNFILKNLVARIALEMKKAGTYRDA